jgi:hypothetical protein
VDLIGWGRYQKYFATGPRTGVDFALFEVAATAGVTAQHIAKK